MIALAIVVIIVIVLLGLLMSMLKYAIILALGVALVAFVQAKYGARPPE